MENEKRIREEIEKKLGELRTRIRETGQDTNANTVDLASIQALQSTQKELDETRDTLNTYQEMLSNQAANVVQFYAEEDFLTADATFLHYHGFEWPNYASAASFYIFATMLVPISSWDSKIQSGSSLRHMSLRLNAYIQSEKGNIEESEVGDLDKVISIFNSCCDIINAEEEKVSVMSVAGAQTWLDDQDRTWEEAKVQFHRMFKFNIYASIEQIRLIDECADIWRARKAAENDSNTAMENAQEAANRV